MSVFLEYFGGVGDLGFPSGGAGFCGGQGRGIGFFWDIESNLSSSLSISKPLFPLSPSGLSL